MEQIKKVNQAARECRGEGFLTFEANGFSNEIERIYLVDEKVEEIETYLEQVCGYESKARKRAYVEQMIARYGGSLSGCGWDARTKKILDENKIPGRYLQTEEVLKALVFLEQNQTTLYVREASMMIYGSSKYFEENTLDRVCHLLRTYEGKECEEGAPGGD